MSIKAKQLIGKYISEARETMSHLWVLQNKVVSPTGTSTYTFFRADKGHLQLTIDRNIVTSATPETRNID